MKFKYGQILVIDPKTDDDCEAVNRKGQECIFIKYGHVTEHAIVKFTEDGKPMYFREADLRVKG